jgi:acetyl-CoA carboxylase / biotin carboxylase 1
MSVLAKTADAANGVKAHTNGTVPHINGSTQSYAARHKLADHFIGGNKLENAAPGAVKDFVAACDGHTVITNVCLNKPLGTG